MNKEHTAIYTVQVPVTFKFTARESLDGEQLFKMAEAYFELHLQTGKIDYNENDIEIVKKQINYSPEEIAEADRFWEEILKQGVSQNG